MRNRANWLFPITLSLILSVASFWLERTVNPLTLTVITPETGVRYVIRGVNAERFDATGQKTSALFAGSLWQEFGDDSVTLQNLRLMQYQGPRAVYEVAAKEAQVLDDGEKIALLGGVKLQQSSSDNNHLSQDLGPKILAQATMKSLHIDTRKHLAQTDDMVNYQYGSLIGSAKGLVYDYHAGNLRLLSAVKAKVEDEKLD